MLEDDYIEEEVPLYRSPLTETAAGSFGKAELPDTLNAKRFRVPGEENEKMYIVIAFDDSERPAEVFAKFPFDNRADQVGKSTLWATVCRLISLSLRYGIPVEEVIRQLDKSSGKMRDLPAQLSKLLKTFMSKTKTGYLPVCPECGSEMMFEEGCSKCRNCGWSKCD